MITALIVAGLVIVLVLGTILYQASPLAESRRWARARRRADSQLALVHDRDLASDLEEIEEIRP